MRRPSMRIVNPDAATAPVPDMRTWWQRNDKTLGVIVGTALLTFITGAGGLTGLAHLTGLATVKDTTAIDAKIAAIVKNKQDAEEVDSKRWKKLDEKQEQVLAAIRSLRADVVTLKKGKKPAAAPTSAPAPSATPQAGSL